MSADERGEDLEALGAQVDAIFSELDAEASEPRRPTALRRSGERWCLAINPTTANALGGLARDYQAGLAELRPDEVVPELYPDDPDAEADWQARAGTDILNARRAHLDVLVGAFEGAAMTPADCQACVQGLTEVRFAIYRAAGEPASWNEADDVDGSAHAVYRYLAWLAEELLLALAAPEI